MKDAFILVTGGAGYIGTHVCVELINQGYKIVVLDNFSNSTKTALHHVKRITQKDFPVIEGDICHPQTLEQLFATHPISAVIHLAGLKSIKESTLFPLKYYENNVVGGIHLLEAMKTAGVHRLIYSSSASVYGIGGNPPFVEDATLEPINPYAKTKLMFENILRDLQAHDNSWNIGILRYFNPIGAHESGLIGDAPKDTPANLLPFLTQVAAGLRDTLYIYGQDYPTPDGTAIRDYIHVVDLAQGHLCALEKIMTQTCSYTVNLGTGKGYSVLDIVRQFETITNKPIPYQMAQRRPGDIPILFSDPTRAHELLDWKAKHSLEKMCKDAWHWQLNNLQPT